MSETNALENPHKVEIHSTSNPLPFSNDRQLALLGHLLINNQFFLQAQSIIQPSCFGDPLHMKIYANQLDFYAKFRRQPSVGELKEFEGFFKEGAVKIDIFRRIDSAIKLTATYLLDVLKEELTEWVHADIFKRGVRASTDLFNTMKSKEALLTIKKMIKQVHDTSFEAEPEVLFTNYHEIFTNAEKEYEHALTFGLEAVDKQLTPMAQKGSLLKGDTTVLLAAPNIGKTTTLITVGLHNVREHKYVIMLTHEGRMGDLYEKIWCNLLNVSRSELFQLYRTKEGQKKLDSAAKFVQNYLTFIPLNKAGLTIEEVEPIIRRKQEQLMARNQGRGYDLLINDYPATLGTNQVRGKNYTRGDSDSYVYDYFVQMALEYNFHALLAMQVNREGSKVNSKLKDEGRFLRMEDAAETFGPMKRATNVFSINRDASAMLKDWVTFYNCKSRTGQTGWAAYCKSNYDKSITHSNELGCVIYNSAINQSDKIDLLLQQNRQKYINKVVDMSVGFEI